VRSWGRVARRLELGERALRRRGCFGARENYYPVLLELASPRSGRPYSRVRPLHRPPAGRKEPPNPIPETHNEHLRRQTLEPCRPCAATTPRATHRPAVAGFWTRGSVHLVVASAAASLAGCRQTANWTSCKLSRAESRERVPAPLQSPLTDSNRRPPPYHEREEGADSCGVARSSAGSRVSLIAARRRVLHGRATLVRPRKPGCVVRPNAGRARRFRLGLLCSLRATSPR
jgi:hypothetical protein